jgi:hypothetical protein
MSVLPLKTDIGQREWHVRYVPKAAVAVDIEQGLTDWSSMADSFKDEAIDDAANRPLLCEVETDQPVRGLGLAPLIGGRSRRSERARAHATGLIR